MKTAHLCSASLGTKGGGVDVGAELIQRALQQRFSVTHLEYRVNQSWRSRIKFAAGLAAAMIQPNSLERCPYDQ